MKTSTKNGSLEDYISGDYQDKIFTFQLSRSNPKPSYYNNIDPNLLEGGNPVYFPIQIDIPSEDRIRDDKGAVRNIRYLSGAKTIFVDQMTKEENENKDKSMFKIINGTIIVPGYDKCMVDYFFMSNWNTNSKNKISNKPDEFFLVDREAHFRETIKKDKLIEEARHWCNTVGWTELSAYALPLFGIDWLLTGNKEVNEVRFHMKNHAMLNPEKFMKDKDSDTTIRKGTVLVAINNGILVCNLKTNTIAWRDNQDFPLSTAPLGVNPIDHFVAATLNSPEGEKIYAEVLKQTRPQVRATMNASAPVAPPTPAPAAPVVNKPQIDTTNLKVEEAEDLIKTLLEKGVITKGGQWLKFGENKWLGKYKLTETLQTDPEMLLKLNNELKRVLEAEPVN